MYSDADLLAREMTDAANTAASGVCPICEEAVDPFHPRWAREITSADAASIAACYGPECTWARGYHASCLEPEQ